MNEKHYFLGCTSPGGFRTPFADCVFGADNYTYIIKGTAGSGKSTLMKRIAEAFPDEEKEIYHCSADPASLDAVYFTKAGVILLDGTAPHVFEPEQPYIAQEIVNAGECLDKKKVSERKYEIISASAKCASYHRQCAGYVTALSAVLADMYRIGSDILDREALAAFTKRVCRRILPKAKPGENGKIYHKQLSAMTPLGYITQPTDGYEVYILRDEQGAAADMFIGSLAAAAAEKGLGCVISHNYMHRGDVKEHLLIPAINTAFLTADAVCSTHADGAKPIDMRRFYDKHAYRAKKARTAFDRRAVKALSAGAAGALASAKECHDELEKGYIRAADFAGLDRLRDVLTAEIAAKRGAPAGIPRCQ